MRTILSLFCGSIVGVVAVVACSDDSPSDADAASCECPAAEAPLPGRLVRVSSGPVEVAINSQAGPIAVCANGSTLISGGCYVDADNTGRQLYLKSTSPNGASLTAWTCDYDNKSTTGTATVHAEAICLTPAP